jgi:hypothetical protein
MSLRTRAACLPLSRQPWNCRVDGNRLSVRGQVARGELPLVGEQAVVHLPVFPLVPGAVGSFGGFERAWVDRLEREVPHNVLQLAGLDVLGIDPGHRLTDVPCAERSLVVGEVN